MKRVVFTWGNPSRGDDGVGPWFADWLHRRGDAGLTLVEDFQLQVEHLLDCRSGELLLFIDACRPQDGDYQFERVVPSRELAHTSHALTPSELLGQYRRVFSHAPPPAFQLSVPGDSFELGQAMSAATLARCRRAAGFLANLLQTPEPERWRALATQHAPAAGAAPTLAP